MAALATHCVPRDAEARVISCKPLLLHHFAAFHESSTTQHCRGSLKASVKANRRSSQVFGCLTAKTGSAQTK